MKSFAEPLPSMVITVMIGFQLEDLENLKVWSEAWVAPFSLQLTPEEERQAALHMVEFQHYIHGHKEQKRESPGYDVISYLCKIQSNLIQKRGC